MKTGGQIKDLLWSKVNKACWRADEEKREIKANAQDLGLQQEAEWWYHLLRWRMREKQVWGEKSKASVLL